MLKKVKLLLVTMAVFSLFAFMGTTAFAANTAQTKIVVMDDDKLTKVPGLSYTVYDEVGDDVTSSLTIDAAAGEYLIKNISTVGAYTVKFTKASTNFAMTVPFSVTALAATPAPKIVTVTWLFDTTIDKTKSGVIGGIALKADKSALASAVVQAYDAKGVVWETKSDSNGVYKLYLVPGSYTLVVLGADAGGNDYKNVYTSVKVAAGQLSGPMDDLSAQTAWTNNAAAFGYSVTTLATHEKKITGYANAKTVVTAYTVDGTTGDYTLIGTSKVAVVGKSDTGAFTITLKNFIPGGTKVSIKVTDPAFNVLEDKTKVTTPLANRTMKLTASTPTSSAGTINTPVVIAIADAATTPTTAAAIMLPALISNVTTVSAVGVTDNALDKDYNKNIDFTVSGGKITFKAGVLSIAQDYNLTVKAKGYDNGTVKVTVGASVTTPPTINSTFKFVPGSVPGSTKATEIGTAATGTNSYKYVVTDSAVSLKVGNALTGGTALVKDQNITGVDPAKNKYVFVYEVKATSNVIVAAKATTMTASTVKPATVAYVYVNGTTMKAITDITLKAATLDVAKFSIKTGTVAKTASAATISGSVVALTLQTAATTGQAVTLSYTKPTTNYLENAAGVSIATFASKAAVNVTTLTGTDVAVPTISAVGTSATIGTPLAATSSEAGILYLVKKTTTKDLASLNAELYGGTGTAVNATAATAAALPTAGLTAGTYVVYGVDWAGNISVVSADVTLN